MKKSLIRNLSLHLPDTIDDFVFVCLFIFKNDQCNKHSVVKFINCAYVSIAILLSTSQFFLFAN